jgi:hypothetical protein
LRRRLRRLQADRVRDGAHNVLLDLEELEEHEFNEIRLNYSRLAKEARAGLSAGKQDTGHPDVVASQ